VRIAKFKDQIGEALAAGGLDVFRNLIEEYEREQNVPAIEIAAALAKLARGDVPLLLEKPDREPKAEPWEEREPKRRFVERRRVPECERAGPSAAIAAFKKRARVRAAGRRAWAPSASKWATRTASSRAISSARSPTRRHRRRS
jgi:hypothetical protein